MKTPRNRLIQFLLLVSALNLLVRGSSLIAEVQPEADWTIMAFMNGDNNLEDDALDDFLEMSKVDTGSKVRVVVQLDRSNEYTSRYQNWTGALRFIVKRDMTPSISYASAEGNTDGFVNDGRTELNMGDPKVLREFVDWAKKVAPAKHYMLIFWNHGQGYRLMMHNVLLAHTLEEFDFQSAGVLSVSPEMELRQRIGGLLAIPVNTSEAV